MADLEEEVSKVVLIRDSLESQQKDANTNTGGNKPEEIKPTNTFKPKMTEKQKQKELAEKREQLLAGRNPQYVLQYLVNKTHFQKDEVKVLQVMYKCFKGSSTHKKIDRLRFRDMVASLFGITNNVMLDRIFQAFDGDNEGSVSEVEWIIGLSALLRGSLDQQIAYTYDVYDINGDRSIGREEVTNCLRGALLTVPGILEGDEIDDATKELVELVMKKFDINHDQNIVFSEYKHMIRHDPLLLELLGECLPDERAAMPFVALLSATPRKYKYYLSRPGDASWLKEKERYSNFRENIQHEGYLHEKDEGNTLTIAVKQGPSNTSTITNLSLLQKSSIGNKNGKVRETKSKGVPTKLKMKAHNQIGAYPLVSEHHQHQKLTLLADDKKQMKNFHTDPEFLDAEAHHHHTDVEHHHHHPEVDIIFHSHDNHNHL